MFETDVIVQETKRYGEKMTKTTAVKMVMINILALGVSGCASMFTGVKQHVPISSNPPGATITINGEVKGKTPASVDLTRIHFHSIKLELNGYEPYSIETTKGLNWVIFWDFFSPFWVGFIVDGVDGAYAEIQPGDIMASLQRSNGTASSPTGVAADAKSLPSPTDVTVRLKQLKEMRDAGLLSEEEYQQKRKHLIDAL